METLEFVNREGRNRLHPSLTNPSWLVLRRRREIFKDGIARREFQNLWVLDVGGRIQPYRPLLQGRIIRYLAVDMRRTPLVNVVGRAEQIPFGAEMFDLVICTQMLEYVSEPSVVIAETYRVLRPGGWLFMSVPSLALRDADEDCWRFLPAALRGLLRSFRDVEVVPEGGSVAGFFRTMNSGLNVLVRYPILRTIFQWTLCPLINLSGALLDRVAPGKNDQFTTNYSVWAR